LIISCDEATSVAGGAPVITRCHRTLPAYLSLASDMHVALRLMRVEHPPAANMAMVEVLADEDLRKRLDHWQEQIEQR
jgi:hypothetical protein